MWVVGHAQVGWFLARGARLPDRDRRAVTWCGCLPDLDAVTLVAGIDAYLGGHHVYLHNLAAAVVMAAGAGAVARRRLATFALGLAAALLHLASDGMGLLELRPLWPFSRRIWWPSQGNAAVVLAGEVLVPLALLAWGMRVFRVERRSVLEALSPRLDRSLAAWLARLAREAPGPMRATPGGRAGVVAASLVGGAVPFGALAAIAAAVLVVVGRSPWPAATWIAAPCFVVLRWVAPALGLRWLRRYARSLPPPGS